MKFYGLSIKFYRFSNEFQRCSNKFYCFSTNSFDFLTSNPAFNIAQEGNKAGTGGNSTLYRTATRDAFDRLLNSNGILLNITLKGIIPDLVDKHFKDYQVHNINLMDDVDVWPYNTCYFFIENTERKTNASIDY